MKIFFIILVSVFTILVGTQIIEILIRNQSKKNKFNTEMVMREITVNLRDELCRELRQLITSNLSETNKGLEEIESNIMVEMACLSAKHDKDIQEIKEKIKVGKKSKRIVQLTDENRTLKNGIQELEKRNKKLEELNKLLKERNKLLEERNVLQLKYIRDSNNLSF
jgi:maltodextrin utilization protein YvdJ